MNSKIIDARQRFISKNGNMSGPEKATLPSETMRLKIARLKESLAVIRLMVKDLTDGRPS